MSYPGDEPPPNGAGTAAEVLDRAKMMVRATPQAHALGVEITEIEGGRVRGRAPYRAELVGNPETGVIAGGVLMTLLDQLSGTAAVVAMAQPTAVATIDLRIDYMRPAEPGRDILAEAKCIRLTRNVAFVHAVAFEDSPDQPIAHAAATFMITGARKKK